MATQHGFLVGDTVQLRDSYSDTVGTVVSVMKDDVRVEWTAGEGYAGKTTMVSVRAVRKRAAG